MHDVLKEISLEVTEESFVQLKYDPQSVWGYIEVMFDCGSQWAFLLVTVMLILHVSLFANPSPCDHLY